MATGRKTGGRKAGTPNKATAAKAAAVAASGLTPVDYLLSVVRDENQDTAIRLDAAKAAAPYVHPRLSPRPPDDVAGNPAAQIPGAQGVQINVISAGEEARARIRAAFAELPSVGQEVTPDVSGSDDGCAEEPSPSSIERKF